jgi:hypothetical protein
MMPTALREHPCFGVLAGPRYLASRKTTGRDGETIEQICCRAVSTPDQRCQLNGSAFLVVNNRCPCYTTVQANF